MYDNLVNEIEHVGEATVMTDITFLPVHLGQTIKAISGLVKKKKKWNVKVLEDEDGKVVIFEDELSVHVPHVHWKNFVEMFNEDITNGKEFDLSYILKKEKKMLKEQLEKDITDLKSELALAIEGMVTEPSLRKIAEHHSIWKTLFGIKLHKTPSDVLIKSETRTEDIKNLIGNLLDVYGDDKGYLELLIEAIKSKKALGSYEVFKRYMYLYGMRLRSEYNGIDLIFEATCDMSFIETESVYVDNEDVLEEIKGTGGIKIVKNLIFPIGPMFNPGFFTLLKKNVKDYEEKEEGKETE